MTFRTEADLVPLESHHILIFKIRGRMPPRCQRRQLVGGLPASFQSHAARLISFVGRCPRDQTLTILIASPSRLLPTSQKCLTKRQNNLFERESESKSKQNVLATPICTNDHRGSDLPPPKSSSNPALDTNKAASRVLDALKHRQAYRERKKRNAGEDDDGEEPSNRASKKQKVETTSLRIQPGESIQHFSR